MSREFIIMRGVSGSGKSFKARQLAADKGVICSADHFFEERGSYDPAFLKVAHILCQGRAIEALRKGVAVVIIDNTHTMKWELKVLKPIVQYAQSLGYSVKIEEPDTQWWKDRDVQELFKRSSHNVPIEYTEKTVKRYEENVTIEDILEDVASKS